MRGNDGGLRSRDCRHAVAWSLAKTGHGRAPAARCPAVALRVEPPACGRRRAPERRPSLPRARRHPPRSLARRAAPDCGPWPCRVTRQCGDQGCAFIAMHSSRVRPAAPAVPRQRPVPVPGDRGLLFLHAARERRPLDELTGVPITALRFVRCTPARSSPWSLAMPDAGPLNASVCSHRLDRRANRSPSVHWVAACAPVVPPRSPHQARVNG